MAQKKIDPRVSRTCHALQSAFIELMLARGYSTVSVGDIARRANVGRSTFYLHYASKEALLRETLDNPSRGLAACVGADAVPPMLIPLLEHFREQRRINRVFFEYPLRALWVRSLAGSIESKLTGARSASRGRPLIPSSLLAMLIAETQIALITHSVSGNTLVSAESIAQALTVSTRALLAADGGHQRPG